jgi:hypothetical protein
MSSGKCQAVRHLKVGECKFKPIEGTGYCKLHTNSRKAKGPKECIYSDVNIKYANELMILKNRRLAGEDTAEEYALMRVRQHHEMTRTNIIISMMPDSLDDIRVREKARAKQFAETVRREAREARHNQWQPHDGWDEWRDEDRREPEPLVLPPIHQDPQSVHRSEVVGQVKDTIQKVIMIFVPAEYGWNMETVSKTPGEIIAECKLSIPATRLLMEKYMSCDTIYEMVPGIYGKTLDSVWQFIKGSSDKEVLIKTLKTELEDNIGMCAQGNLTRLCNVLQGYVDGLSVVGVADILGDLLPPLMSVSDREVRREKALQILRTHGVPEDKQEEWLEPLMDD